MVDRHPNPHQPDSELRLTGPAAELHIGGPAGRIAVVDHGGAGPPVILLHGANRTLLDWQPLLPHLDGLRLVSYDLRGHGHSDVPADGDYSWDAHLSDLDAVTAALDLDAPFVVGHSLGGMVAVSHGHRDPGCPGVIDLDGFGGTYPEMYPGLTPDDAAQRRARQTAALVTGLGPAEFDEEQLAMIIEQARLRAAALGLDPDHEEATARRSLQPVGPGTWSRKPAPAVQPELLAPLEGWSVFALIDELACPALLVQGAEPPPLAHLPTEFRELLASLIAGIDRGLSDVEQRLGTTKVVRVEGAGHLLHLQVPAAVGDLVRRFCRQV